MEIFPWTLDPISLCMVKSHSTLVTSKQLVYEIDSCNESQILFLLVASVTIVAVTKMNIKYGLNEFWIFKGVS